jgi:hypothetical protein
LKFEIYNILPQLKPYLRAISSLENSLYTNWRKNPFIGSNTCLPGLKFAQTKWKELNPLTEVLEKKR